MTGVRRFFGWFVVALIGAAVAWFIVLWPMAVWGSNRWTGAYGVIVVLLGMGAAVWDSDV